jgi:hypothetical protein
MTLPARLPIVLALIGAAALPAAASAATPSPTTGRPHSRVVTYDRGEVRVQRLEAATRRADGRLHTTLTVTLRNRTDGALTRYVRLGRCTGGSGAAPACPATTAIAVRLAAGQTRTVTRAVVLRQPAPGVDAIEATVGATRRADRRFFRGDAELLLRGTAWRGAGAGHAFGVRLPAGDDQATRLSFDVPQTSPGHAYVFAKWEGTAAPGAPTTIARCTGDDCAAKPLTPQRGRSGGQMFGDRFGFDAQGAPAIRLAAATADGTSLLQATLPWPALTRGV